MKKLISMLCIAAVSITFSYTNIAEARRYDSEEAFLDNNTRNHGQKTKKQKKQKNKSRKQKNKRDTREGKNRSSEDLDDGYGANDKSEQEVIKKQKNNKKCRGSKKNKRNKRNLGRQEEVLHNDAQYDIRSGDDIGEKQLDSNEKNQKSNDSWKYTVALADEKGHVTNPEVNGTRVTMNDTAKAEKKSRKKNNGAKAKKRSRKKNNGTKVKNRLRESEQVSLQELPPMRITKGLTRNVALGTNTEQLIQPKHNNKRDLKEPIQLRQELERYRKMFAQVPISDETA